MTEQVSEQLDHVFRKSHGKLLSMLLAKFGTDRIESAEGALMESYYKAMKVWPYRGEPKNPQAWLYRSASNALIDDIRKSQKVVNAIAIPDSEEFRDLDKQEEIDDPELKLLFLICHPSLKPEDQLAFMLKTLSGFGDHEISEALMVKKVTIKKRLLRARNRIAQERPEFSWPSESEIARRITLVHRALYLLFNEGFYSSHPEYVYRKDLCLEAMRLCKYLADHKIGTNETYALLSLMCYHISRFEARIDDHGEILLLPDQDRSRWDPYFIKLGGHYLSKSVDDHPRSRYQIEAFISATHCMAKSLAATNWKMLRDLYQGLYHMTGEELVVLNLVIVNIHLEDLKKAEELYKAVDPSRFANKTVYFMVGIKLYEALQDNLQVELFLEKAVQSSRTARENALLAVTKRNMNIN